MLGVVDLRRDHAQHKRACVRLLLQLIDPVLQAVEGLRLRGVVDEAHCRSSLVVDGGERSELLGACGVPNLQLDLDGLGNASWLRLLNLGAVIASNGGVRLRERVLHVPIDDASLAHAGLTQHDHFVRVHFV